MGNKKQMFGIVCLNKNNVIGNQGGLVYNIKADMQNFKRLTTNNVVVMGRKTFESLPAGLPLKNRINIIVTRQENYQIPSLTKENEGLFENTFIVNSLEQAQDFCEAYYSDKKVFIIGGGEIYKDAYEKGLFDEIIVTQVSDKTEGDTYFPDVNSDAEYEIIFKTTALRDQASDLYYKYIIYKKK